MPPNSNIITNAVVRHGIPTSTPVVRKKGSQGLHRTWAFRLVLLAWIAMVAKSLSVGVRGLAGFYLLCALAMVVSVFEGSITAILKNAIRNGRRNLLMVLLVLWYGFFVFAKMYLWDAAETDWRLVMQPIVLICALLMGFGFLHEDRCARTFQIALIFALGLQSVFSGQIMLEDSELSRRASHEMGGAWAYGDQGGFALQAMLLPVLLWRALSEKGWLRWGLLAGCAAIAFSVLVCNFQTAILLLAISIPTAALLGFTLLKQRKNFIQKLVAIICLLMVGVVVLQLLWETPLMEPTVEKVMYLWEDPTSGGYNPRGAKYGSRWMLSERSFFVFCEYPLFGKGSGSIRYAFHLGGHSSFFDMLGFYGLLGGGGAFIALLFLLSMRALRRLQRHKNWVVVTSATCVVLFLIAGVVNPYWEGSIALVFLVARLFRLEGERT